MKPAQSTLMRRVVSIPAAIVIPPLGVLLARGIGMHLYVSLALLSLAILIFVFLYAGIGVLLYLLAMSYGFAVTVWTIVRKREG